MRMFFLLEFLACVWKPHVEIKSGIFSRQAHPAFLGGGVVGHVLAHLIVFSG